MKSSCHLKVKIKSLDELYRQSRKLLNSQSNTEISKKSTICLSQEKESITKLIEKYNIQSKMKKTTVSSILIQIEKLNKDKDNNRRYVLKKQNKKDIHLNNPIPDSIKVLFNKYKKKGYQESFINHQNTLFDEHPLITTRKEDVFSYYSTLAFSPKNKEETITTLNNSHLKNNKYFDYLKKIKERTDQRQNIKDKQIILNREKLNKRDSNQLCYRCLIDWKAKEMLNDNHILNILSNIDESENIIDEKLLSHRLNRLSKCLSSGDILSEKDNKEVKKNMIKKKHCSIECKVIPSINKVLNLYNKTSISSSPKTDLKNDLKGCFRKRNSTNIDIKSLSNNEILFKLYETERSKSSICDNLKTYFDGNNKKEMNQILLSPFPKYFSVYTQRIQDNDKEHKVLNWINFQLNEFKQRNKFRKKVSTLSELNTKLNSFNSTSSFFSH